ncbi:MAG: hypothetical protein AB1716_09045 [Planctomycetota bacterium]
MKRAVDRRQRRGTGLLGPQRRGTVLLMVVGLLAMLFILVSAYIVMARYDRQTLVRQRQGDRVREIIDAANDVVMARIRGAEGADAVVGMNYVRIPGFSQGAFIAGDMVHDPDFPSDYAPNRYSVQPTSLREKVGVPRRTLDRLLVDTNPVTDPNVQFQPGDPSNLATIAPDTLAAARRPLTNATGSGFPDAALDESAALTELANAMAEQPIRAALLDPSFRPADSANDALVQQLLEQGRYVVATKVESHGGKLRLALEPDSATAMPWNTLFTQEMFRALVNPNDGQTWLNLINSVPNRRLLQEMAALRGAVEPQLRRRGGLLDTARSNAQNGVGLPPPLVTLQQSFWHTLSQSYTFSSWYGGYARQPGEAWQPFILANIGEWHMYRQGNAIDPVVYERWFQAVMGGGGMAPDPREPFAQRPLLTTENNSDELAWIQDPDMQKVSGLKPGALKYFLGRITDTTVPTGGRAPLGAFRFDPTLNAWVFNDALPVYPGGRAQGFVVIQELAEYYYEMLRLYEGWGTDDPANLSENNNKQSVSRRRQALMLAVNTVAFAAPRIANAARDASYFDSVYYREDLNSPIYVGYTPQPFITRLIAYNKTDDPNSPSAEGDVGILVELYNPNDPKDPTDPGPVHDQDLTHFALTVNDQNANDPNITANANLGRGAIKALPGRSFEIYSINDATANTWFENPPPARYGIARLPQPIPLPVEYDQQGEEIVVKLWHLGRSGSDLGWYVIDQYELDTQDFKNNEENYVATHRNTTYENYLGRWGAKPARWRMTVAFDPNDPAYTADQRAGTPDPLLLRNQVGVGGNASTPNENSPAVPLYTMNANIRTILLHGAPRPASFPTVGFLAFVPRFSHVHPVGKPQKPMTVSLYEQWNARGYSGMTAPADFGHMPIFENKQEVKKQLANNLQPRTLLMFADHDPDTQEPYLGNVPWGQLVFDYFTTLDPNNANYPVDPYRVPGRIDVNAASWYMLSQAPAFGPVGGKAAVTTSSLPWNPANGVAGAPGASPAFWSVNSGVLAGAGRDLAGAPLQRYPELLAPDLLTTGAVKWRLGPHLAIAAAEYRDRTAYVPPTNPSYLGGGYERNGGTVPKYRAGAYGSLRRETQSNAPKKLGFISVGELANARGFDSLLLSGNAAVEGYKSDYMKAAGTLALLDTHFLTTRSNTYTVYMSLMDLKNPQASVRSQVTVDRSNVLPRLVWHDLDKDGVRDPQRTAGLGTGDHYEVLAASGVPEIIGKREVSYYNARYDE